MDSGNEKIQTESDDEYVVINVENPIELCSYLKQKTDKRILVIYQDMIPSFKKAYPKTMPNGIYTLTSLYNYEEKFFMAENLLKIYENAFCVITDRLHCALPCLAFNTPVLLLKNKRLQERFNGIDELLHRALFEEYYKEYNMFDVDNPPENSKDYLKIRKNLIEKCEKFTGTVNNSCYSNISYQQLLESNSLILSKNAIETREYIKDIVSKYKSDIKTMNEQKKTIDNLNSIIKEQEKKIALMESSNSWKLTKPLRSVKKKLK